MPLDDAHHQTQPALGRRGFLTLAVAGAAASAFTVTVGTLAPGAAFAAERGRRRCRRARAAEARAARDVDLVGREHRLAVAHRARPPTAQQAEFLHWLDVAEQFRLNAVFVQVRPTADAFWPSPLEPWSQYLTGVQGGDPGYDPLAFIVERGAPAQPRAARLVQPVPGLDAGRSREARARAPGAGAPRVGLGLRRQALLRPRACPRRRSTSSRAILHAVEHYDLDGVHFDDYFYPVPGQPGRRSRMPRPSPRTEPASTPSRPGAATTSTRSCARCPSASRPRSRG